MKKVVIGIILVFLLIGCSKPQTNDVFDEVKLSNSYKGNKITGSVVGVEKESYVKEEAYAKETEDTEENYIEEIQTREAQTAIDALKLQMLMTNGKEGNFYPRIQTTGDGEDALKEKTKALHQLIIKLDEEIEADKLFGVRFFTEQQIDEEQEQLEDDS